MRRLVWLGLVLTLVACAGQNPSTLPPPASTASLPGARANVFRLATAAEAASGPASVCATSAGHCPVPADTPAGLRCTCEAADGSYAYAGRTGEIPPMPAWADPAKQR